MNLFYGGWGRDVCRCDCISQSTSEDIKCEGRENSYSAKWVIKQYKTRVRDYGNSSRKQEDGLQNTSVKKGSTIVWRD